MDGYINKRILLQEIAWSCQIDYATTKKIRKIVEHIKEIDLLDRDTGLAPVLEEKTSTCHVLYDDGIGRFESHNYTDWMCPKCGWFVGELYSGFGRWHIQREMSYCARCGQKIDWSLPKAEEKKRYEEEKRKYREDYEKKTGHRLDNMHEGLRRKYGELND